jgi:hypothetical protein
MDTLHTVLRSIRGAAPPRRDHLDVFREFLDHLDRAAKRRPSPRSTKAAREKSRSRGARRG